MENFKIKIKYIFIPFLTILFANIFYYSLLRFFIDINHKLLHFNEITFDFIIPFGLSIIFIFVFLRKPLGVLNFDGFIRDGFYLTFIIIVLAITLPNYVFQEYLKLRTNNLIELNDISEIDTTNIERFYKIKEFKLDYNNVLEDFKYKNNYDKFNNFESKTLMKYFIFPINSNLTSKIETPKFWCTFYYSDVSKYDYIPPMFEDDALNKFGHTNFYKVEYFENLPISNDREFFYQIIKNKYSTVKDVELFILQPHFVDFYQESKSKLYDFILSIILSPLITFLIILRSSVSIDKLNLLDSSCAKLSKH